MLGALSQCYRTCIWQNARLAVNRVVPAAISTRAYSVPSTPPPPSPQFSGEQWGMITAQFSKGVNKSILSRDPEVVWSERETHQVASLNRPLDAYAGMFHHSPAYLLAC